MTTIERVVGRRIREAREFLGLTQEKAAQALGITRAYLSMLERGERRPPSRLLARIAELYGRSEAWFLGVGRLIPSFQLLLRKAQDTQTLPPEARKQLVRFVELCEEITGLREILQVPPPDIPHYPVTRERLEEQAREAALAERSRLGLDDDPVPHLDQLLESEGIPVIHLQLPEEISGAMAYEEGKGGFLLINASKSPPHRLWTVAHEYGHLLKDRDHGFVFPESVQEPNGGKGTRQQLAERFANRFAAHFLMPEVTLLRLIKGIYKGRITKFTLVELRRHFGVSYAALLYRLRELGILKPREVEYWKKVRLYSLEEVLYGESEEKPVRYPVVSKVLWELVLEAAQKGEISTSYAGEVLGLSPMEVQDILMEVRT